MQLSERFGQRSLAWAIICLCLSQEALATRSHLRANHVHNHVEGHEHNKHAVAVVGAHVHKETSAIDRQHRHLLVEEAMQLKKPHALHHVEQKFMTKARDMDAEEIVDQLGDKLPPQVRTLVHSASTKSKQPFSEKSLQKARKILNGMIEDAQKRLDVKMIECTEFQNRNRGNLEQVITDQARLSSQLANLERMIGEANTGQKDMAKEIELLEEKIAAATKAYNEQLAIDTAEMTSRKNDLAVAEFILSFTVCKEKPSLFAVNADASFTAGQSSSVNVTNIGVLRCAGDEGKLEFRFQDPKLERLAQRHLTPGARLKLHAWLSDAHDAPAFVQAPANQNEDVDDDADDDDDEESNTPSAKKTAATTSTMTQAKQTSTTEAKKTSTATTTTAFQARARAVAAPAHPPVGLATQGARSAKVAQPKGEGPPMMEGPPIPEPEGPPPMGDPAPEVPKEAPGEGPPPPADQLPAKCTLGKPNCGLLHDNMSIMWGKFKDAVDEQQDIMDENAAEWKKLQADFAAQMDVFVTADANFAEMLAEATANKNADLEEQAKKDEEFRLLELEYKEVWGECVAVISEILFTDICGVKTVRGEVAKFSKDVPPEKIVDCEVSDFIPLKCSVECDDECDPHGSTPNCGGMTTLVRQVIQDRNEFGLKCPQLTYPMKCNQIRCPVDCLMGPWSGWGKCTKECEGGTQTQTRNLVVKPLNGGASCDPSTESQPCNVMSCDRDCTTPKWTPWTQCTQACSADGKRFGEHEKFKHIKVPTRGKGKCPKSTSWRRYRKETCNRVMCQGDEMCIAGLDLFVALDGSGSLRSTGYKVLKKFSAAVVRRFKGEAFGREAVKVGAIQFGNGKILKDGIISPAIDLQGLTFDIEKVAGAIEASEWQYGFTNMAQVFAKADQMSMNGGRKKKPTSVLIITDGKPSFVYNLAKEVDKMKQKGVRIIMVELNPTLSSPDKSIIKHLASSPTEANYLHVKGMKVLDREMDKWIQQVVVQACPKAHSKIKFAYEVEMQGFELLRENQWCGDVATKDEGVVGDGKPHMYLGTFQEPADCLKEVMNMEGKYFSFGKEPGFNKGKCYLEPESLADVTPDLEDKTCTEEGGWSQAPVDFYEVIPMEVGGKGEGPPM